MLILSGPLALAGPPLPVHGDLPDAPGQGIEGTRTGTLSVYGATTGRSRLWTGVDTVSFSSDGFATTLADAGGSDLAADRDAPFYRARRQRNIGIAMLAVGVATPLVVYAVEAASGPAELFGIWTFGSMAVVSAPLIAVGTPLTICGALRAERLRPEVALVPSPVAGGAAVVVAARW